MEEDADDLDNLFDEYDTNDRQPQENADNENNENDAVPEKVPVPKRVVKHPRLKFNPERLCGKRGIPILVDHFKDVNFKGKGHEKEDLKKLLTTLELWTHRLFPSMKFEDCLRQIEHLGKKRPVKTCLQKIRLDFPILDRDFVHNEDEEEEQEQPNELESEPPAQDAFDRLFDDYRERTDPILTSTPSTSYIEGNVLGTTFGSGINEEQKKRMEYNKMLAIERRKARLSTMQSSSPVNSVGTNIETDLGSKPNKRKNDVDLNFLFNYLQEQFTNIGSSSADKNTEKKCGQSIDSKDQQISERDEMMKSVEESDLNENDQHMLPNVKNNDCTEDNDKVELGLDELMDLVDEDNRDEIDHDASCTKDKIDHDALSNICPDDNGKVELCLDELMNLVNKDDKNETDHDILCAKDNDKTDHNALSNARNDEYSENKGKEELGLDELMELVEEDHQDTTDDVVMPLKNAVSDTDN